MNNEHPITPTPELVEQWAGMRPKNDAVQQNWIEIATQAARWGADQELEACCEYISRWFATPEYRAAELRTARRPKPPSLKDKALAALQVFGPSGDLTPDEIDAIRRALESVPD